MTESCKCLVLIPCRLCEQPESAVYYKQGTGAAGWNVVSIRGKTVAVVQHQQLPHVLCSSVLITSVSSLIEPSSCCCFVHKIQFQQVRSSMIGLGFNILMTSLRGKAFPLPPPLMQNKDTLSRQPQQRSHVANCPSTPSVHIKSPLSNAFTTSIYSELSLNVTFTFLEWRCQNRWMDDTPGYEINGPNHCFIYVKPSFCAP